MVLNGPVFRALRGNLWLPLIRSVAAGNPSVAAVVTMGLFVVPSVALTVLVALRIARRPGRAATVRRVVLAVLLLLPAVSMVRWGRGDRRAGHYAELAGHLGTKEVTDAVTHALAWGAGGLFLWGVLALVAASLGAWRRLSGRHLETYVVVGGGGLATYWTLALPLVAHRAVTTPLEEAWSLQPWLG